MFHRNHVAQFVAALNFTSQEGEDIKKRAEAVIAVFSSSAEGHFSGGKLEEVLGSPELVRTFGEMWEKHQIVWNP
ncbi:hypothetical protein HY415_00700 [Candidatus Kaiserbacteria bacterium]|nr:hypothetical protein [Candidatus Kaiserbacteria bacterium]